jgi:hypothetical protein
MNTISKRIIAVALMAVLLLGLSTCKKENIEIIARPTVKLFHEATITDYTKASVTAEVTDEGGAKVTERGFVYGLLEGNHDTIAIPCGSGKGVYFQDLSNLQPNTTYVYWAYAINTGGYGTSPKDNFTTKDNLKPIVKTGEQVSVTTTTAVIGGNKVTNDGGDHVTERGVCYSTDTIQLTVSGVRVPAGEDMGEFSCRLEDLTPNTTYYYCAYAKNSKGPGYGNPKSFTTEALPTYTIEVSANPSNGGTATGGGIFDEGQRCTVVATPNTGYNFVNWTDENNVQVYDSVRYTIEVRGNRNLVAHFTAQAYTIRATVEPEGSGTIEGVGGYNYGDQCTLIATPNPGYAFEEWTENGSHIDASANYPFTVTGNRNLVAHFRVAEFNLAVTANPMVIPQGDNSQLNAEASGGNGSFTYNWSPASSLSNASIHNPTASPMVTTTYTCTATSAAGSTESGSCTVTVVCPPTDLTATVQNTNQVRLTWTAPNTYTSFKIYRNNTLIKSNYTSITYTDTNLSAGTYSYQVTAVYNNVESPKSSTASVTVYGSLSVTATASPNTIPNGSSSTLTATATGGNGSYTYSWTPNTVSNSHVQSPTASPSTTTAYTVTVSSNGQTATANVTVNVVRAPTNLTATVQNTNQVRLTWTAPNTVTSYKVYRNNTLIKSGLTTTTYTDSNLGAGTYSYQVTAVYNNVESPKSNTDSATVAPQAPTGAINGLFTINNSSDKVYFSQGNLQYNAAQSSHQCADGTTKQGTWRFAENQWDYVGTQIPDENGYYGGTVNGSDNHFISQNYNGWIDLFGWGTSGYHDNVDSYNVNYQPWSTSDALVNQTYNYFGYGPSTNMASLNLTGSSANYDWGVYNAISNGGGQAGLWRTLTKDEWMYVFNTRNASTINGVVNARYVKAKVVSTKGIILFPDSYVHPFGVAQPIGINEENAGWNGNYYNDYDFAMMEAAGAVFLPVAGERIVTSVSNVGQFGTYWSASHCEVSLGYGLSSYFVQITYGGLIPNIISNRRSGMSVRLVRSAQ